MKILTNIYNERYVDRTISTSGQLHPSVVVFFRLKQWRDDRPEYNSLRVNMASRLVAIVESRRPHDLRLILLNYKEARMHAQNNTSIEDQLEDRTSKFLLVLQAMRAVRDLREGPSLLPQKTGNESIDHLFCDDLSALFDLFISIQQEACRALTESTHQLYQEKTNDN